MLEVSTSREVEFGGLEADLQEEFGSSGWVTIEEVTDFVKSDKTGFHTGHRRIKPLNPMETKGSLEVNSDARKRKGSNPGGTKLRFVHPQEKYSQGSLF